MASQKQPLILVSSSSDLRNAREKLSIGLRQVLRDLSLRINPYLWEDETDSGRTMEPGTPIQKQINAMLGDRVQLTIVMFGERIGEPLSGEPVEGTAELLARWEALGLRHPWPEHPAERRAALDAGQFPLTGTVYELLVALSLNAWGGRGQAAADRGGLSLLVGYAADRATVADTTRNEITLNQERWFAGAEKPPPSSDAFDVWKRDRYEQQVQGVINLVKALARSPHGSFPIRFDSEDGMVEMLSRLAVGRLQKAYPADAFEAVFKPDLSPFRVDDPMPFPDREGLRETLQARLVADGAEGQILALRGSSGCGKSSLLQKGLLGEDPPAIRDAVAVVLHPSDIGARSEPTPLQCLLCILADRLEGGIGALPGLRAPAGGRISDRIDNALDALERALDRNRAKLILGIDQFEEIVDLAARDTDKQRGQPRSWWQVLHFIGRAARRPRIWVAVTLESQRLGRVEDMAIEDRTGIHLSYANVEFEVSQVAEFVRQTAARRGLPVAPRLADAVERMVEAYEEERRQTVRGGPASSFLPLLSLWLHRLFVKFRDRKRRADEGSSGAFGRTADPIGLEDLRLRGIDMQLGPLVSELVWDAWDEAGELSTDRDRVTDENVLRAFIGILARSSPGGRDLVTACSSVAGFDLHRFITAVRANGISAIPGVALASRRVRASNSLDIFLGGLVGVDDEGNMRLTEMPRANDVGGISRLIEAHLKRRLLERVATTHRVRLIHQAVVDNWPPARAWYEAERKRLVAARDLRQAAHAAGPAPEYAALAQDAGLVSRAAALLSARRSIWSPRQVSQLSDGERMVRSFCLGLLAEAPDGRLTYDTGGSDPQVIAFEAARYDVEPALRRWLDADPDLVTIESESGETLLDKAAWFAPAVIELLLARDARLEGGSGEWHPIAGAIHAGNLAGLRTLLTRYDGPEAVIGPSGATMLHVAAISRSPEALRVLLDSAGDPNIAQGRGLTPLHRAAGQSRSETAELLLDAGADPLLRDEDGDSVLHFAARANCGDIVRLLRDRMTDEEREILLFGSPEDGEDWQSPIEIAAYGASPDALTALLEWAGSDPVHRGDRRSHPLLAALARGARPVPQPLADRIGSCVRAFLDHGGIPGDALERALRASENLPDAHRMIENHMVLHADNLDEFSADRVLAWITGKRPEIAAAALRKRPDVLDRPGELGRSAAWTILQKAAPETLLLCLADDIQPAGDREVFRLEAALKVCRAALSEGRLLTDQGAGPRALGLLFPGVPAERLHPIIEDVVDAPDALQSRRLLGTRGGSPVRTVLHRIAAQGDLELYRSIVEDMAGPPPRDAYGRPPSAMAPPAVRRAFESLEASPPTAGVH